MVKNGQSIYSGGKDIVIAVKAGGADPNTNSRLRQIIQTRSQRICQRKIF